MGQRRDIVVHHLRIFGIRAEIGKRDCEIHVEGVTVRLLDGDEDAARPDQRAGLLRAVAGDGLPWSRLRTFHIARSIARTDAVPVVVDGCGRALWAWLPEAGGTLLIGTDLASDLTLIRQGDPAAADRRPPEALWGIAGERPNYLFESQLESDRPQERLADWWMWALREALCRLGGVTAGDILPFGVPGAVVITGDDDQAPLADYAGQAERLGGLPVTYFLHPLTQHDCVSLCEQSQGRAIEWELHPDALDAPAAYADRLREQCEWFRQLTGRRPRLLRNHGFLNDGYWGHAASWIKEGIAGSSNIPGVDGRVVNGSLLPARLALATGLTLHWSLLTTFGDGVFFIYTWDNERALAAVKATAEQIVASGVPGIIVLNLHPANHEKAAALHEAAHRLVSETGFCAMNLGDALSWFAQADTGVAREVPKGVVAPGAPTRRSDTPISPRPIARLRREGVVRRVVNAAIRLGHWRQRA
jgi:hypothetical protein